MQSTYRNLAVVASLTLLSACNFQLHEHVEEARESQEFRVGNRVDMIKFDHTVGFAGGKSIPSDSEFDRLDAFFNGIILKYGDTVTLRGGADSRRETLAIYIERLGLPIDIRSESGTRTEMTAKKVSVTVERHTVTPPPCPNWSNFHGNEQRNTPGSNYGCSTDAALGYMIANPRDLIEGQPMGPALATPGIEAQRRYQADKTEIPKVPQKTNVSEKM